MELTDWLNSPIKWFFVLTANQSFFSIAGVVHHRGGQRRRLDEGEEAERRGRLRPHLLRRNHPGEKQQRCCHLHLKLHLSSVLSSVCHPLHLCSLSLKITLQKEKKKKDCISTPAWTFIRFPFLLSIPSLHPPVYSSNPVITRPPLISVGLSGVWEVSVWAQRRTGKTYLMLFEWFVYCIWGVSVCVCVCVCVCVWERRLHCCFEPHVKAAPLLYRSKCLRLFYVIY